VNELTKKIYICPFTGKVFGDNTCANPQDAIYEWVSRCPENTERVGGLRVKRFFVSEDSEVIRNYITKRREPISKIVFSSVVTGKLFNSKESVIEDFVKNQLKTMSLLEVTNQNRYQIEESFLAFIQTHFADAQINAFVEALSSVDELSPFVEEWLEGERLVTGSLLLLDGPLGAGKTTFVKGVAVGMAVGEEHEVTSPTFPVLQIYKGKDQTLFHFDLFRIPAEEFLASGWDEHLHEGVLCMEWGEKIADRLTCTPLRIAFHRESEEVRRITWDWNAFE
jgi:tRNA threonylcarbamoyl adenosine modification protein YjeE